jgi:hypothetical protein
MNQIAYAIAGTASLGDPFRMEDALDRPVLRART